MTRSPRRWLAAVVLLLTPGTAAAEIVQTGFELVSTRRVTRTVFEYRFRVRVESSELTDQDVHGTFTSTSPSTTIVDGAVDFGRVPALGTTMSADTFSIRHDRRVPFDPSVLEMQMTATSALRVALEPANAVSGEIGAAGGEVAATGASGAAYRLAVPPDVSGTATVTVTPISGMEGFALGPAVLAAVRLEPAGVQFVRPATLTITAPGGAPLPASAVAFHFLADGVDLVPITLQGGATAVPVSHFSDVVVVDADALPGPAGTIAQSQFDGFMEWTQRYLEGFGTGDWGYFTDPSHHQFPECRIALGVIGEALGLCRLSDVVGGSQCNAVMQRLQEVLLAMMDGRLAGANVLCSGQNGDDTPFLQCQAAVEEANEIVDQDLFVPPKTCGAQRVVATPDKVLMDSGDSAAIDFTVLDGADQPIPGHGVRVANLSIGSVVALSIPDIGPVVVTCNGVGSAMIRAWDAKAFALGVRDDLLVDVPIFCSPTGIVLRPASRVVIGTDPMTFRVSLLDAAGNPHPVEAGIDFSWRSDGAVLLLVTPNPLDPSVATVHAFGSQAAGSATVTACLGPLYPCDVNASAQVTVVPDLRGTWYGGGYQTAESCTDPEDNGTYFFADWVGDFSQSLDPQIAPFSDFSAQLTGSGMGELIHGPLEGTMSSAGLVTGSALYSTGTSGGTATFTGHVGRGLGGQQELTLDFSFRDSFGDSCRGTGSVLFQRTPPPP